VSGRASTACLAVGCHVSSNVSRRGENLVAFAWGGKAWVWVLVCVLFCVLFWVLVLFLGGSSLALYAVNKRCICIGVVSVYIKYKCVYCVYCV
jgi:hypothetical protein